MLNQVDKLSIPYHLRFFDFFKGLHKIEDKESFFIGRSTTNKEALKMLRSKRIGTFLVRFSSKEQKYCINSKNEVNSFSSTVNE